MSKTNTAMHLALPFLYVQRCPQSFQLVPCDSINGRALPILWSGENQILNVFLLLDCAYLIFLLLYLAFHFKLIIKKLMMQKHSLLL